MELAVRKKDPELFKIRKGDTVRKGLDFHKAVVVGRATARRPGDHILHSLHRYVMAMSDGSTMWKYLRDRFEGTTNGQTRAMTKLQLYVQMEAARCKPHGYVEGHLNYMCRLKPRLKTAGMTLDDAVITGSLHRYAGIIAPYEREI